MYNGNGPEEDDWDWADFADGMGHAETQTEGEKRQEEAEQLSEDEILDLDEDDEY